MGKQVRDLVSLQQLLSGSCCGQVAAVVGVQSLAQEFPRASGGAKKKQNKTTTITLNAINPGLIGLQCYLEQPGSTLKD